MQHVQPSGEGPRDDDIVEMLRDGAHVRAFERLVERYERKVFRLCCALLRDPDQARDAAQESLVRVWRALPRYDRRATLSTWIYTITRNRCLTALGQRRQLDSISDPAVAQAAETAQAQQAQQAQQADPDCDPLQLLRELVDALPERYRQSIILFYYEERSVSEVAGMLGLPEGTVKTNLHRARAMLLERVRGLGLGDLQLWLENAA